MYKWSWVIFVKKSKFHDEGGPDTVVSPINSDQKTEGHLHREILIFSQKSLRTIYTYQLVPFKLPKNVQRGPFQGLLVFRYFFQKISNFTKYALTPLF